MMRRLGMLIAFLLIAHPVSASHRPGPGSLFPDMEAELTPVLRGVFDARSAIPSAVQGLSIASSQLRTADLAERGAIVDEAFAHLGDLASDGLGIIGSYPHERCAADYRAILQAGLLLLGDAADDPVSGSSKFNLGTYLAPRLRH